MDDKDVSNVVVEDNLSSVQGLASHYVSQVNYDCINK